MIDNDGARILEVMAAIPSLVGTVIGVSRDNKIDSNEALTDADILIDEYLSRELRAIAQALNDIE